jgi:hypothetical protein
LFVSHFGFTHAAATFTVHTHSKLCSLLTAHCSLLTAHCSLFTALCFLLTAHCSLLSVLRLAFSLRSSIYFFLFLFLLLFPCLNLSRTDQSILTVCTLCRLALAVLIVSQHPQPRSSLTPQDPESSSNTLSFDQVQPRKISIVSRHLIISPGKISTKMSTEVPNLLQQTELDVNHIS